MIDRPPELALGGRFVFSLLLNNIKTLQREREREKKNKLEQDGLIYLRLGTVVFWS